MVDKPVYQLVIYATPGELHNADNQQLIALLADQSFIGDAIAGEVGQYFTGERFLDCLTFMGCSPSIALSPEDGDHYCQIQVVGDDGDIYLYAGENTQSPHCRQCGQTREDWGAVLQQDYCDQCQLVDRMSNHVWKKTGALTKAAIMISHIHPSEAVPVPDMLNSLEQQTGVSWKYVYV